jgi:hypothetical protein
VFSPKKKSAQDVDPSPVQLAQVFFARIPSELNPMPKGIETLASLSSQLHHWLEGKKFR